mmetsp:Transcript_8636/g.27088  ORF Transcript_8636/g.27088 Transcript_8636/m.27088 type:complete len:271 (+) Transcript_8636:598-1410(+)
MRRLVRPPRLADAAPRSAAPVERRLDRRGRDARASVRCGRSLGRGSLGVRRLGERRGGGPGAEGGHRGDGGHPVLDLAQGRPQRRQRALVLAERPTHGRDAPTPPVPSRRRRRSSALRRPQGLKLPRRSREPRRLVGGHRGSGRARFLRGRPPLRDTAVSPPRPRLLRTGRRLLARAQLPGRRQHQAADGRRHRSGLRRLRLGARRPPRRTTRRGPRRSPGPERGRGRLVRAGRQGELSRLRGPHGDRLDKRRPTLPRADLLEHDHEPGL